MVAAVVILATILIAVFIICVCVDITGRHKSPPANTLTTTNSNHGTSREEESAANVNQKGAKSTDEANKRQSRSSGSQEDKGCGEDNKQPSNVIGDHDEQAGPAYNDKELVRGLL